MKIEEFIKLTEKKKKNKYNAKAIVVNGIKFRSIKESNYYLDLLLAKKSGELINFYMQVPFRLPGGITYRLDFLEFWKGDIIKYKDTKGFSTREFINKKKQVEEFYDIEIELV